MKTLSSGKVEFIGEKPEDFDDLKKVLKALDKYSENWSTGIPHDQNWLYQAMWNVKKAMWFKLSLTQAEFNQIVILDQTDADPDEEILERYFDDLAL